MYYDTLKQSAQKTCQGLYTEIMKVIEDSQEP